MLVGIGILQYSGLSVPTHCDSEYCKRCFHVSNSPVVLLAYTLPSQSESIPMSRTMLPGASLRMIGTRGQMFVLGHFCTPLLVRWIQSAAYCAAPILYRCEPEPKSKLLPAGRCTFQELHRLCQQAHLELDFQPSQLPHSFPAPPPRTAQSSGPRILSLGALGGL
jgi:hypothetical protein